MPPTLHYETPAPVVPTALKVVAWLFLIGGALSILQILIDLAHHRFTLATGVLGVFVGPGLLRFSPGWRTCGLVLLWLGMILLPIGLVAMLSARGGVVTINFFGLQVGRAPMLFGFLFGGAGLALTVWQYRVLVREDVRSLFGLPPRSK